MDTPTPNIPLLRKAVEWVEAEAAKPEPEREWWQGAWRRLAAYRASRQACGTAYCVAGYVCHISGEQWFSPTASEELAGGVLVPDRAAELLGLSAADSNLLFAPFNSAADVRRIAEGIAGERL